MLIVMPDKDLLSESVINALGSPHFDPDKVIEAMRTLPNDGSITALMNILPEITELAKILYDEMPEPLSDQCR